MVWLGRPMGHDQMCVRNICHEWASGVNVRCVPEYGLPSGIITALWRSRLKADLRSTPLLLSGGLRPCMGDTCISRYGISELHGPTVQQDRALFPALRLGTGWSLEGFQS